MSLEIHPMRTLTDNYTYLLREAGSNEALVIDPSEAQPVKAALHEQGWTLKLILNTHHHHDHVGGNTQLASETGAEIFCSERDRDRVPGANRGLKDGESFHFGKTLIKPLAIPGHTQGQIAYYIESAKALFVGDTVFAMGCGRLLEGTPEQMYSSMQRILSLPRNTQLYFGHEYTERNASFAKRVDPKNLSIHERLRETEAALAQSEIARAPTIAEEMRVNPFFRAGAPEIKEQLSLTNASDLAVFTKLRQMRDTF